MFTANTMNCLTEALGMALPGSGTIPAVDPRRLKLAWQTGEQIVKLLDANLLPRGIMTTGAFENAFAVDMALGGSTNSVLHLTAVASEAGVDFPLSKINAVSDRTPCLAKIRPSGEYHIDRKSVV